MAASDLPGRPNGSSGWISQQGTRSVFTAWHGCVRLGSSSITWLAERIGPGVPVTIYSA